MPGGGVATASAAAPLRAAASLCGSDPCRRAASTAELRFESPGGSRTQGDRYAAVGEHRPEWDDAPYDDPEETEKAWGNLIPTGSVGYCSQKRRWKTADVFENGAQSLRRSCMMQCCSICGNDEAPRFLSAACSTHYYCIDCMRRHAEERIKSGFLPFCFSEGCGAKFDPSVVRELLGGDELRLWEMFKLLTLKAERRFGTCPNVSCGTTVLLTEAVQAAHCKATTEFGRRYVPGLQTAVRCPACLKTFCMICSQPAHPRSTCEEARRGRRVVGSIPMPSSLGEDVRECPRCGSGIQKADEESCDHMTCRHCGKEFCWACMADRNAIYFHGNHYHESFCRYFAPYSGPDAVVAQSRCKECFRRGKACRPPTTGPL